VSVKGAVHGLVPAASLSAHEIEGTHHLNAPRDRVYQALIDPEILKRCIPAVNDLRRLREYLLSYDSHWRGAIKGVFTGTVRLEEMRPPEHYRIVVEGKGAPGFLKGSGNLDLEVNGEGTLIKYTGDLQLGGTIASVGQRMIQGTAKLMASQFFTALEAEAKTDAGEPPPKHGFFAPP